MAIFTFNFKTNDVRYNPLALVYWTRGMWMMQCPCNKDTVPKAKWRETMEPITYEISDKAKLTTIHYDLW